jgi:hypothetical protein
MRDKGHRGIYERATGVLTLTAHGAGHDIVTVALGLSWSQLTEIVKAYPYDCCEEAV